MKHSEWNKPPWRRAGPDKHYWIIVMWIVIATVIIAVVNWSTVYR